MFKMGIIGAVAVAVLALFVVVRHTRAEEETGRLELLGATVVGRRAPLTAALLVAGGASLVAGAGAALGLIVGRHAGRRLGRSWALGFACLGLVFAAVAGVTAQLVRSARAASGLAGVVLGVAYLLRAIGDASAARPRLAVVALARRLVAADAALRRRPLVGAACSCSASPS